MGKGPFRKLIKGESAKTWELANGNIVNAAQKKEGAATEAESGGSSLPKDDSPKGLEPPSEPSREKPEQGSAAPEAGLSEGTAVYDDMTVCRLLRIHRRVLAAARTKTARGKDWDCVGLHAGMTRAWIDQEALKRGIVPDFTNVPLKAIEQGDRVVSCILMGTWANRQRVTVKIAATDEIRIATVKDADDFSLYEIFDAIDYGSELCWEQRLNNCKY